MTNRERHLIIELLRASRWLGQGFDVLNTDKIAMIDVAGEQPENNLIKCDLSIKPAEFDFLTYMDTLEVFPMWVWINDIDAICWRLEANPYSNQEQTNTFPHLPVLFTRNHKSAP